VNSGDAQSFSIGAIVGGETPSNRQWDSYLVQLTKLAEEVSTRISATPRIHVFFQIPGPYLVPEFAGVAGGAYSRKDLVLGVMVALQESPPVDGYKQLTELLVEAVHVAIATCVKRRIPHHLGRCLRPFLTNQPTSGTSKFDVARGRLNRTS
jgi:hypothetical protein